MLDIREAPRAARREVRAYLAFRTAAYLFVGFVVWAIVSAEVFWTSSAYPLVPGGASHPSGDWRDGSCISAPYHGRW